MPIRACDLVKNVQAARELKKANPDKYAGMTPSRTSLSKVLRDVWHPCYGMFIGAYKSGKTAALLTIADEYSCAKNFLVHYHAIEGNSYGLALRLEAGTAEVDMDTLEADDDLHPQDRLQMEAVVGNLGQRNYWMSFGYSTISEIVAEVNLSVQASREAWARNESWGMENPKVCLVLDYANRLNDPRFRDPVQMERALSNALQRLSGGAVDNASITPQSMLGEGNFMTVWSANQVLKEIIRKETAFNASSGRGASSWQEDPDILGVLNKVKGKDGKTELEGLREVSWTMRNRKSGVSLMRFDGGLARLYDASDQDASENKPAF